MAPRVAQVDRLLCLLVLAATDIGRWFSRLCYDRDGDNHGGFPQIAVPIREESMAS